MSPSLLRKIPERISPRVAAGVHLFVALIIFSPVLFLGKLLIGSTDNYYHHIPNLLFNLRAFQAGELGLWNPHLYGGIDFSASAHNFIYYPGNWPLFLFPEKFLLVLFTLKVFLEVWLLGVVSFLFFREEVGCSKAALFSSLICQLGGYMFFSITTYPNLTHFLLAMTALYLVYTIHRRKSWLSAIFLTGCVTGTILCGNKVYAVASLFLVAVVSVYRFLSFLRHRPLKGRSAAIIVISLILGVMIAMIQILPFADALVSEGNRLGNVALNTRPGGAFLALTAFIPELMGVQYRASMPLVERITHFRNIHVHDRALDYFGVFPLLLLLWGGLRIRKKELVFWLTCLVLATLWYLRISPVSDILNVIFFPFLHEIVPRMMIPVCVCALAGHVVKETVKDISGFRASDLRTLSAFVLLLVLSALAFYAICFGRLMGMMRNISLLVMMVFGAGWIVSQRWPKIFQKALGFVPCLGLAASSLLLFCCVGMIEHPLIKMASGYAAFGVLGVCAFWLWMEVFVTKRKKAQEILWQIALAGGIVLLWGIFFAPMRAVTSGNGFPFLAALSILRSVLLAALFLILMMHARSGKMDKALLLVTLMAVMIFDLALHNSVYSHMVRDPFFKGGRLYPSKQDELSGLKLNEFRVNVPHFYLGLEEKPLYYANVHSVYGVRSFSGVNSDRARRHVIFESIQTPQKGSVLSASQVHHRFLDLTGAAYDISSRGERFIRPGALSRFMLFKDYEIVLDDRAVLDRLMDKKFVPQKTVIIPVDLPFLKVRRDAPAYPLSYQQIKTSEYALTVQTDSPAVVFFGDSFHKGWTATVNGKDNPVVPANFKFMATAVPPGTNKVVFRFRPKLFDYGLALTVLGLFGLCLFAFDLFSREKKKAGLLPE